MLHISASLIGIFLLIILSFEGYAQSENSPRKLALVIGNSQYRAEPNHKDNLINSCNDAHAVAKVLRENLKFDQVFDECNLDKAGMSRSINVFIKNIKLGDLALVYYAGHGVHNQHENYMLPVQHGAKFREDLKTHGLSMQKLVKRIEDTGSAIRIALFDACRDNPLPFKANNPGPNRSPTEFIETGIKNGTIVQYSASVNWRATDGAGSLSPYAAAFVSEFAAPNTNISVALKNVASKTIELAKQENWKQDPSTMDNLYHHIPVLKQCEDARVDVLARGLQRVLPDDEACSFWPRTSRAVEKEILKGSGILYVESSIETAAVYLDGIELGLTPFSSSSIRPGKYLLTVDHNYHLPCNKNIEVLADTILEVNCPLSIGKGNLLVIANPKGAWVEIDGQKQSSLAPLKIEALNSGLHDIRVGMSRYRTVKKKVSILPNDVGRLEVELKPILYGSLRIDTTPSDSTIKLEGLEEKYEHGMELSAGDYTVSIEKPGYRSRNNIPISVAGGDITRINEELEQLFGSVNIMTEPENRSVEISGIGILDSKKTKIPVGKYTASIVTDDPGELTKSVEFRVTEGVTADVRLIAYKLELPRMLRVPESAYKVTGHVESYRVLTKEFYIQTKEISEYDYYLYCYHIWGNEVCNPEGGKRSSPITVSEENALRYIGWISSITGIAYRLPTKWELEAAAVISADNRGDYFDGLIAGHACGREWVMECKRDILQMSELKKMLSDSQLYKYLKKKAGGAFDSDIVAKCKPYPSRLVKTRTTQDRPPNCGRTSGGELRLAHD